MLDTVLCWFDVFVARLWQCRLHGIELVRERHSLFGCVCQHFIACQVILELYCQMCGPCCLFAAIADLLQVISPTCHVLIVSVAPICQDHVPRWEHDMLFQCASVTLAIQCTPTF